MPGVGGWDIRCQPSQKCSLAEWCGKYPDAPWKIYLQNWVMFGAPGKSSVYMEHMAVGK